MNESKDFRKRGTQAGSSTDVRIRNVLATRLRRRLLYKNYRITTPECNESPDHYLLELEPLTPNERVW